MEKVPKFDEQSEKERENEQMSLQHLKNEKSSVGETETHEEKKEAW